MARSYWTIQSQSSYGSSRLALQVDAQAVAGVTELSPWEIVVRSTTDCPANCSDPVCEPALCWDDDPVGRPLSRLVVCLFARLCLIQWGASTRIACWRGR